MIDTWSSIPKPFDNKRAILRKVSSLLQSVGSHWLIIHIGNNSDPSLSYRSDILPMDSSVLILFLIGKGNTEFLLKILSPCLPSLKTTLHLLGTDQFVIELPT